MRDIHSAPALVLLLLLASACSEAATDDGAPGGAGASGAAGSGALGGNAPSGGAGSGQVALAGSGQALGGGDQGQSFSPDQAVGVMPPAPGGSGGAAGSGGSGIKGDGNTFTSMIRGSINGTAVFTQKGEDVELMVSLSNCADGNHQFRIHDGYSCDSSGTQGMPWGLRGTGIGPESGIACASGKGTLMYTRSGADKTRNWTVADQALETDVTAHVVIVSDEKDPSSRAACGNFF